MRRFYNQHAEALDGASPVAQLMSLGGSRTRPLIPLHFTPLFRAKLFNIDKVSVGGRRAGARLNPHAVLDGIHRPALNPTRTNPRGRS